MTAAPTDTTCGQESALKWREDDGCEGSFPEESEHMSDDGCSSSHENSFKGTSVEATAIVVVEPDSVTVSAEDTSAEAVSAEAAAPSAARTKDLEKLNRLAEGARRLRLKNRNRHVALMDAMEVPVETDFVTGLELALDRLMDFQGRERASQMQLTIADEHHSCLIVSPSVCSVETEGWPVEPPQVPA